MNRDSELYELLHSWYSHNFDAYIDPYEVVEDRIPDEPAALRVALRELDNWLSDTTPQERFDEVETNDWMPFDLHELENFLGALRRRLVSGIDEEAPTPLAAPPEYLDPRDRAEGAFPELQRLARYMESHVSGESVNPYLSEADNRDVVMVTTARLADLAELYQERLLQELRRIYVETDSERDRLEALGGEAVWDPTSDVDYWLDIVEFYVRYCAQMERRPQGFTPEALEELRENAALWPPLEASRSWAAQLLYPWRGDDPYPGVEEVLARYDRPKLQSALGELDDLLGLVVDERRRVVEVLLTEVPKRPPLDEFLAQVRRRVVSRLGTM